LPSEEHDHISDLSFLLCDSYLSERILPLEGRYNHLQEHGY